MVASRAPAALLEHLEVPHQLVVVVAQVAQVPLVEVLALLAPLALRQQARPSATIEDLLMITGDRRGLRLRWMEHNRIFLSGVLESWDGYGVL
jgi:hypothetical protein